MTTRARVLVADDESTIATTLKLILIQAGYQVAVAFGGRSAIEVALDWRPHLFLSDVVMPDMSGIEAAIEITRQLPDCRVLLLSGHAVVYDLMREAREIGYDFPVLTKPIHPLELLEFVKAELMEQRS